jgi:NAD(P)-dependent dehydrogenase (short-subunit alcohol dehydrogenase family)
MAQKPVVLITGGNTGLGLEIVKALAKESTPFEIIIGSRSVEKGEDAIKTAKKEVSNTSSTFSVVQVDITSDGSIQKAYDTISSKFGKLDCLVNNAGSNFERDIQDGKMSMREAWNKSWDTNVTGTQIMTQTFIPLLLKSQHPRIIFMTSGTSPLSETERFDNPVFERLNGSPPAGWPKDKTMNPVASYRSAKTGLNMMMREWHKMLLNDGVKVFAVSPGFLATGLSNIGAEQLKEVSLVHSYRPRVVCIELTCGVDGCERPLGRRTVHQGCDYGEERQRCGQGY